MQTGLLKSQKPNLLGSIMTIHNQMRLKLFRQLLLRPCRRQRKELQDRT